MDRFFGLAPIALGIFLIWNCRHLADEQVRQQNWMRAALRMKRRYGEKEYRHNVRASIVVGVLSIVFGLYTLVTGW